MTLLRTLRERFFPAPVDSRREAFLDLIRSEDVLGVFARPDGSLTVDADGLVTFARGVAVEALEGRYESTRAKASEYGIPSDALDLAAAAALVAYSPNAAAALLSGPNEVSTRALHSLFADAGLRVVAEGRP